LCNSSHHATNSCPYYAYYVQPNFASPMDNTDDVLTVPDSSFPLAQCTGLEVGEPFWFDVSDACYESKDTFDKVHNLDYTHL